MKLHRHNNKSSNKHICRVNILEYLLLLIIFYGNLCLSDILIFQSKKGSFHSESQEGKKQTSALIAASDCCSGEISTRSGCLSTRLRITTEEISKDFSSSTCYRSNTNFTHFHRFSWEKIH